MQKDTNVSTELGRYMSVNRTFTKNSKRLFLITHCFLLTLLIEGNILKQTGNGCAVVVYRSAFTCLAIMSSFQLPLHDFYSGLKGKKAVSMSLMFSLTVKTIRGNILIIDLKLRSKKKLLFSVFCRLYFNTKLLEDTTDKDENCWQSFFLFYFILLFCLWRVNLREAELMRNRDVTSTGTKNQLLFTFFFFLFSLTKKSVEEYTYYCSRRIIPEGEIPRRHSSNSRVY